MEITSTSDSQIFSYNVTNCMLVIDDDLRVKPSSRCNVERIECAAWVSRVISSTINHITGLNLTENVMNE
jgi:hypothetical protein